MITKGVLLRTAVSYRHPVQRCYEMGLILFQNGLSRSVSYWNSVQIADSLTLTHCMLSYLLPFHRDTRPHYKIINQ